MTTAQRWAAVYGVVASAVMGCATVPRAWDAGADPGLVERRLAASPADPDAARERGWLCLLHDRGCPRKPPADLPDARASDRLLRAWSLQGGAAVPAAAAWLAVVADALSTADDALATAALRLAAEQVAADPLGVATVFRHHAQLLQASVSSGAASARAERVLLLAQRGLLPSPWETPPVEAIVRRRSPVSRRLWSGLDAATTLPTGPWQADSELLHHVRLADGRLLVRIDATVAGVYALRLVVRPTQDGQMVIATQRPSRVWCDAAATRPAAAPVSVVDIAQGEQAVHVLVPATAEDGPLTIVWLPRGGVRLTHAAPSDEPLVLQRVAALTGGAPEAKAALQRDFPHTLLPSLVDLAQRGGSATGSAVDRVMQSLPYHRGAVRATVQRLLDGDQPLAAFAVLRGMDDDAATTAQQRETSPWPTRVPRPTDLALAEAEVLLALELQDTAARKAAAAARLVPGYAPAWRRALALAVEAGQRAVARQLLLDGGTVWGDAEAVDVAQAWQWLGDTAHAAQAFAVARRSSLWTADAAARWRAWQASQALDAASGAHADASVSLWSRYQAAQLGGDAAAAQTALEQLATAPHGDASLHQRAAQLLAKPPWQPFARDLQRWQPPPIDPRWLQDSRTAWLLDQEVLVLLPGGGALRRVHQAIEVRDDEAAEQVGEVRVAEGADLEFAHTRLPDGTVVPPAETVDKDSVSLRKVAAGAVVEYAQVLYVAPDDAPTAATRFDPFLLQATDAPVALSEYVVLIPDGVTVTWAVSDTAPAAVVTRVGPWTAHIYRAANLPRARGEPRAVRFEKLLPSVTVAVNPSRDGLLGPWDEQLAALLAADAGKLEAWLDDLRRGPAGRERWQRLAYRIARGVVHDHAGGPHGDPGRAVEQQRGDRAALFYVLARHMGVDACMVRVLPLAREHAGEPPDPADYALTLVRLKLADGDHWYDPGIEGGLLDHLRAGLRGRPAWLTGCQAAQRQVTTPALGEGRDLRQVRGELFWQADGSIRGTLREQFHGALAAWLRHQLTTRDDKGRAELVASLAEPLLAGVEAEATAIDGLSALGGPLQLTLALRAPPLQARAQRLDLGLYPQDLHANFCVLPRRRAPLLFGVAQDLDVEITVHGAGDGSRMAGHLAGGVAALRWQRRLAPVASGMQIHWRLVANPAVIAADDYPSFAEVARQADAAAQLQLQR